MDKNYKIPENHYLLRDCGPMEVHAEDISKNKKTLKEKFSSNPLCFCGQSVKVGTVKKEGANQGKTFYTCGCKIYNPDTKEQFGGCEFFSFKGDQMPTCTACQLPMRMFKNILSSAKCINPSCKLKLPDITDKERAIVVRLVGGEDCTCGNPIKLFKRGDGCSAVCGSPTQTKCSFRVGMDLKKEIVYFTSE